MKFKLDSELSETDKIILSKSRTLANAMWNYFAQRSVPFLNDMIKTRGEISQIHMCTFFSEMGSNIIVNTIRELKNILNTCEDGEHTHVSLFDELVLSAAIKLGIYGEVTKQPISENGLATMGKSAEAIE